MPLSGELCNKLLSCTSQQQNVYAVKFLLMKRMGAKNDSAALSISRCRLNSCSVSVVLLPPSRWFYFFMFLVDGEQLASEEFRRC
jgi:hypothetical protein